MYSIERNHSCHVSACSFEGESRLEIQHMKQTRTILKTVNFRLYNYIAFLNNLFLWNRSLFFLKLRVAEWYFRVTVFTTN